MKAFWKKEEKKTDQDEVPKDVSIPETILFFNFHFEFEDGKEHDFKIHMHPETLQYLPQEPLLGDEWTRLEHCQCENCPLNEKQTPHCPIALSIEGLVKAFSEKFSYERADITVDTIERTYFKKTTMQKGVSSIMGILMVSSGCPVMDKLRPMVRFHLPWSTLIETTFRTTSTYLLGQFFLHKEKQSHDFSFDGLVDIYKKVNRVNKGMAKRIGSMAGKDASVNALIILDIFAIDIPLTIEDQIEELRPIFQTYFE